MQNNTTTEISAETKLLSTTLLTLIVAAISGFATYPWPSMSLWSQWTYLAHTLLGIIFSLFFFRYLIAHIRRTLGARRGIMLFSGLTALSASLPVIVSGYHITFFGQQESLRWVYSLHVAASMFLLITTVSHVVAHGLTKTRKGAKATYLTLSYQPFTQSAKWALILAIAVMTLSFSYDKFVTEGVNEALITPYEHPYGDNPFAPSQNTTQNLSFVNPTHSGNSNKCGTCHAEITEQWKSSIHSQAAADRAYQKNINLLAKKKGMAATRYCEGCHAPVAIMGGQLSTGGKLDTVWHMDEGVSCMGCHGISNITNIRGNAGYAFKTSDNYIFNESDSPLQTKLHNFVINIQPKNHRNEMSRPLLKESMVCAACHAQFMDKEINNWGWVKMQDDYSAWLNSPFSGQSKHTFKNANTQRCHDCHFQLEKLNDPSSDINGMTRSHRTIGANTAIPWLTDNKKQLELTTEFLQNDKVRLSIKEPNRSDARRSTKPVNPDDSPLYDQPYYYYLGEEASINIIVSNSNIGHDFPGGTTDINEAWVYFRVVDAQNNTIYESGHIDSNNNVDDSAYFYRSVAMDRHGNEVWKHDLFNMSGDSYKKIIKSGESDIINYRFSIPAWAKGPLQVSATLKYRKFNHRYAQWAFDDPNVNLPIVDMSSATLSIPIRIKPEVTATANTNQ